MTNPKRATLVTFAVAAISFHPSAQDVGRSVVAGLARHFHGVYQLRAWAGNDGHTRTVPAQNKLILKRIPMDEKVRIFTPEGLLCGTGETMEAALVECEGGPR